MNTKLIKENLSMYKIKFDQFVEICFNKFNYYITKNDYHTVVGYYLCKSTILLLHVILLLLVVAIMSINKLTSILFHKWTQFMNIIGRKRIIIDRESESMKNI